MQYHISRVLGGLLILVGVSVFLIRLHHAGPYAMPGGGNLVAGVLALALGFFLVAPWSRPGAKAIPLVWLIIAAGPVILFFALYATLAELEEVISIKAFDRAAVNNIHRRRHEKYMIQRLATQVGIFGETAGAQTVTLRLDPCP